MSGKKQYPVRRVLWTLIIIGFAIMEFPGIFFINRIEPLIFGLPFIYGFTIVMWAIMCAIMLIGYKLNWGKGSDFKDPEEKAGGRS
jgi:hypothetical protein